MKKILLLVPQNVIPAIDGGKLGIYKPMQMLAKDYEVKAIVFTGAEENFDASAYSKIGIDALSAPINKTDSVRAVIKNIGNKMPFKFAKYYNKRHKILIEDICKNWQPDVLICHHAHLAAYCIGLKKNCPSMQLILREHNVEYLLVKQYYENQNNFLLRMVALWQFGKTKSFETGCWDDFDKIIFISDSDFKYFAGANKQKGYIIYDGADKPAEMLKEPAEKSKAFLFTGSIATYQNKINLNNFIRCVWIPWKQNFSSSQQYQLWITGDKDKAFVRSQLTLTAEEEDKYNIKVLGFVDDIAATMRKAQFFLSPTVIGAGIRIKVLQALSMGCVIFLTQKDIEMSSALKDGYNVLLYKDATSLNSKFNEVANADNSLYKSIAQQAESTSNENFTWLIFYNKLKKLL